MKRLTFLLFAILVFASCEGPMGPMGPPGLPGNSDEPNWKIIDIDINRWTLSDDGTYFYAQINVPELSNVVYTDGLVLAYHETIVNSNNYYKTPLPYTRYNVESNGYQWSEMLDFTYTPGRVTFYSNPSDFFTGIKPEPIYLTLALHW